MSTFPAATPDLAGWPNGRRPNDDVTDVALRVVAGVLAGPGPLPGGRRERQHRACRDPERHAGQQRLHDLPVPSDAEPGPERDAAGQHPLPDRAERAAVPVTRERIARARRKPQPPPCPARHGRRRPMRPRWWSAVPALLMRPSGARAGARARRGRGRGDAGGRPGPRRSAPAAATAARRPGPPPARGRLRPEGPGDRGRQVLHAGRGRAPQGPGDRPRGRAARRATSPTSSTRVTRSRRRPP